ncbi:MAG: hypothetical protein ACFFA5_05630 [Promethearchaeota archaeon]
MCIDCVINMKLPCKNVPEEFCLNNICEECCKLLQTMEEIPVAVPRVAVA